MDDIYKSAMRIIESHDGEDFSGLFLTAKTISLVEMDLFDLHAIPLTEFIKIKIEHFLGEGKIAQYNQKKYGEENAIKYGHVLENLLKNEENTRRENETKN